MNISLPAFSLAATLFVAASFTPVRAAQIWLSGVDPFVWHVMEPNKPSDYMDLFSPDAPWAHAAEHVQVFKTSTQFLVRGGTDAQLRQMFENLSVRPGTNGAISIY